MGFGPDLFAVFHPSALLATELGIADLGSDMAIDLRLLSMAILRGPYPKTETIPLPSLYKDKPVVLYAIRRMG